MNKTAHVYGGGSIKGAWQIGAINNVLSRGIYPEIITGISVGNLNANLLATRVGNYKQQYPNSDINWSVIIDYLKDFWFTNITSPKSIICKKSYLRLAIELFSGTFNGVTSTAPLRQLVNKNINSFRIHDSGIKVAIGCTDLIDGKLKYIRPSNINYKKYMLASSSIPFLMPLEKINSTYLTDGGLIDSAPIGRAIKMGAKKVIVFANHPEEVGVKDVNINNPIVFAERIMDIVVNNTLNNDIEQALLINELLSKNISCKKTEGKKYIDIKIIRPQSVIDVDINKFNSKDISEMYDNGWKEAEKIKLK